MQFGDVIGNIEVIESLKKMIDSGRMPHATLFTEKAGCGAIAIALATAQYIFCKTHINSDSCSECNSCVKVSRLVHPDLHFIFPTNTSTVIGAEKRKDIENFYPIWREFAKQNLYFSEQELNQALGIENKFGIIGVSEANAIIKKLSLSSCEGGAKIVLILFPERMNLEAANKLLKTLEEPMPNTYFIMVSHNPNKIISTIISRCRIIELPPIKKEILSERLQKEFSISEQDGNFWANCARGSYSDAVSLIKNQEEQSEYYTLFIDILNKALAKDLPALLDIWENISTYGKEKQRNLCIEGEEILRKIYMTSLGLESISYSTPNQASELKELSCKIKPEFYKKGYDFLNSAIDCLERNVNPKFIFCDLCNCIYHTI